MASWDSVSTSEWICPQNQRKECNLTVNHDPIETLVSDLLVANNRVYVMFRSLSACDLEQLLGTTLPKNVQLRSAMLIVDPDVFGKLVICQQLRVTLIIALHKP